MSPGWRRSGACPKSHFLSLRSIILEAASKMKAALLSSLVLQSLTRRRLWKSAAEGALNSSSAWTALQSPLPAWLWTHDLQDKAALWEGVHSHKLQQCRALAGGIRPDKPQRSSTSWQ